MQSDSWSLDEATEISIRRCIEKGILSDILTKYGMEVYRMILTEYNEKEEREYLRRESIAEGIAEGLEKGIAEGMEKGIAEGIEKGIKKGIEKGIPKGMSLKTLAQIQKKYAKGKSLSQMAEELEEEEESLRPLYELVVKYPDKTAEELTELLTQ